MASQIGSAITPGGHQAYADLINREQFQQAQGMQAMQQQAQLAMQQQALEMEQQAQAQRNALAQQQMAQSGYQFERGMQDITAGRAHDIAQDQAKHARDLELLTKSQQFQQAQTEAMQKFSERQAARIQRYDMELEQLRTRAQAARDAGMLDVVRESMQMEKDVLRRKSRASMALALESRLQGQTVEGANRLLSGIEQQVKRVSNMEQQNQTRARAFAPQFISMLENEGNQASINAFEKFYSAQAGGADFLNPFSPDFTEIRDAVNAGAAPGMEFLTLTPTSLGRLGAASFYQTPSARAVGGEMNSVQMTDVLKSRIAKGTVNALQQMGLKNLNAPAAQELVEKVLAGGATSQEIGQMAERAGVPASTLRMLLSSAAENFENLGEGSKYMKMKQQYAQLKAQEPEDTLQSLGLKKAIEAFDIQKALLRRAANVVPGMDMSEYEAGIEAIADFKRTGAMSGLFEAAQLAGMGSQVDELQNLMSRRRRSEDALIGMSRELGDVAEEEAMAARNLPVRMLTGRKAGESGIDQMFSDRIADLLREENR